MCCVTQIRGMHTIIRDASTSKNDFVFFADRLSRLVVEAGLGHLPFREKTVITPTGGWDRGVCKAPVWQPGVARNVCTQGTVACLHVSVLQHIAVGGVGLVNSG